MNDIKTLPFEQLFSDYKTISSKLITEQLELAISIGEQRYNERLRNALDNARLNDDSEAGSDGIEEAIKQVIGDFDPDNVSVKQEIVDKIKITARVEAVSMFVQDQGLANAHSWFPHQLLAYFGSWEPIKDNTGKYSRQLTLAHNCKSDFEWGILMLAVSPRTPLFEGSSRQYRQYNSPINPLVPIVLAGLKQYKGIRYSEWNRDGLGSLVEADLYEAMVAEVPELSVSQKLDLRNTAIVDKTGKRAGIPNDPVTCTKTNGLTVGPIAHLPKLAKYMTIQTWCAHPLNRTALGIYDPSNWDVAPAPLVVNDLVKVATKQSEAKWTPNTKTYSGDTPW